MIEVKDLVKTYGTHKAVRGISFTVESGKIYGFLGPNGAGKSTTMNIICGTLASTSGTVTINGHDIYAEPLAAKKCIGYLPEIPPLYIDMTPEEYLDFVGRAKGLRGIELAEQIEEVMGLTDIAAVRNRLIKNLSKGYKQRVGIAQAMLGNPEIIILDEPTVGLDPIQIIEIRELIRSLGKKHTVILSSHILTEISEVCDHVIIISKGKVVADDKLSELEEKYTSEGVLELQLDCSERELNELKDKLAAISDGCEAHTGDDGVKRIMLKYRRDKDIRRAVYAQVHKANITLLAMIPHEKTLEDIFLALTADNGEEEENIANEVFGIETESKPDSSAEPKGVKQDDNNDDEDGDDYKPLFG
ncbi:MAG: ABC transporter ATP-binding protein [Ruminococcaceae bacterium]|nr:ABC transporter ATP-binding protein [Oscillospiraceae bacterium]